MVALFQICCRIWIEICWVTLATEPQPNYPFRMFILFKSKKILGTQFFSDNQRERNATGDS